MECPKLACADQIGGEGERLLMWVKAPVRRTRAVTHLDAPTSRPAYVRFWLGRASSLRRKWESPADLGDSEYAYSVTESSLPSWDE